MKALALFLTILLEFICGEVWHCLDLRNASIFILFTMLLSLGVKIGLRWRSYIVASKDNFGKKPSKVSVMREGERCLISEDMIKVGDVLLIDFNESLPVSGILITPN